MAIYGFARLVDQIGDEVDGDRLALLDALERGSRRVFDGEPEHPLLRTLVPTVRACGLPREPFLRLIEANRRDQVQVAYATFDELVDYCTLSANPVGELVLHVFGAATPEPDRALGSRLHRAPARRALAGRRPRTSRARADLPPGRGPRALRRRAPRELARRRTRAPGSASCSRSRSARARRLLDEGAPLVGTLRGRARIAVAGYVGGGRANADAIARAGLRRARRAAARRRGGADARRRC